MLTPLRNKDCLKYRISSSNGFFQVKRGSNYRTSQSTKTTISQSYFLGRRLSAGYLGQDPPVEHRHGGPTFTIPNLKSYVDSTPSFGRIELCGNIQSWTILDKSGKPWCRNADAVLTQLTTGQNTDAFMGIPAFTFDFSTSQSKLNTTGSPIWTCRVSLHHQHGQTCRSMDVQGVHLYVFKPPYSFVNAGMPDRPSSDQSGTGMKNNVPEAVRYRKRGAQPGTGIEGLSPVPE
jgi:hypothetical protein